MKLTPPKKSTFWISVALAAIGVILFIVVNLGLLTCAWLGILAFALVVVGFILLTLALNIKGI